MKLLRRIYEAVSFVGLVTQEVLPSGVGHWQTHKSDEATGKGGLIVINDLSRGSRQ